MTIVAAESAPNSRSVANSESAITRNPIASIPAVTTIGSPTRRLATNAAASGESPAPRSFR
jgi:hypothetical protein